MDWSIMFYIYLGGFIVISIMGVGSLLYYNRNPETDLPGDEFIRLFIIFLMFATLWPIFAVVAVIVVSLGMFKWSK